MAAADKATIARPTTTPHAALGSIEVNDEWATVVNHGDEQDASVNALMRDASLPKKATSCDYGRPGRREPPAPVVVLNARKRKSTIADKRPAAPALVKDGSSAVLDALHRKQRRTEGTPARSPLVPSQGVPSEAEPSLPPSVESPPPRPPPPRAPPSSTRPPPPSTKRHASSPAREAQPIQVEFRPPSSGKPPVRSARDAKRTSEVPVEAETSKKHTSEDHVPWMWPPPGVLLWPSPPGGALLPWPASPPPSPSAAAGDQAADFDASAGDRDANDGRAAVAATRDGDAAAPCDRTAAKEKGSTDKQDPSNDSTTTGGKAASEGQASSGDCCPLNSLMTADRAADAPQAPAHREAAVLQGDRKGDVASDRAADALPQPASARVATSMPLGDRGAAADRGEAVAADRAADVLPASTDRAVPVAVDQAADQAAAAIDEAAVAADGVTDAQLGDRAVAMDVDHAFNALLASDGATTAGLLGGRGAAGVANRAANVLQASADGAVAVAVDKAAVAAEDLAKAGAAMAASNRALEMAAAAATQATEAMVTAVAAVAAVKVAATSTASAAAFVVAAAGRHDAAAREEMVVRKAAADARSAESAANRDQADSDRARVVQAAEARVMHFLRVTVAGANIVHNGQIKWDIVEDMEESGSDLGSVR